MPDSTHRPRRTNPSNATGRAMPGRGVGIPCVRPWRAAAQRGVTLLECTITVAVVAILVGAGVPTWLDTLAQHRVSGHAHELATDLRFLRSHSVLRSEGLRISFREDAGGTCYVIHRGPAKDCQCASDGSAQCTAGPADIVKAVAWPASGGVRLQSNVASMHFEPRLGIVSPTGTLRIEGDRGHALRHVVNLMGRVRTCSPGGAGLGHPAC